MHRDIKLENIAFKKAINNEQEELKLLDFGLCKQVGNKVSTNSIVGTSFYCAPEVLDG